MRTELHVRPGWVGGLARPIRWMENGALPTSFKFGSQLHVPFSAPNEGVVWVPNSCRSHMSRDCGLTTRYSLLRRAARASFVAIDAIGPLAETTSFASTSMAAACRGARDGGKRVVKHVEST